LAEAKQFVLELEVKYGRAKVIEASEALSKAEGKQENLTVYLTAEARRLAWQLLGRPPEAPPLLSAREMVGEPKEAPPEPPKPKRSRKKKQPAAPTTVLAGSPLMQQYREAKERHPGMLLLFRVGDFYELFDEDARTAAKLLGLTLTSTDKTTDMAGFPHHSLETYLRKLVTKGHRVAVCEQVEEVPGTREVTRVLMRAGTEEETAEMIEEVAGQLAKGADGPDTVVIR
jgi:hypothetical protein